MSQGLKLIKTEGNDMKKIKILISLSLFVHLAATPPLHAASGPTLTVGNVSGAPNSNVDIPISFDPWGTSVAALQFTLTLPPNVSNVSVAAGPAAVTANKTVSNALQGSVWNFIVAGLNQTTIGAGVVVTATVYISPGTAAAMR